MSSAQTKPSHSCIEPGAASGDLLYVSDDGVGAVLVYAYTPHAIKFVGELAQPTQPGPICVDKDQNVWILGSYNSESYEVTEYAHGGTSPKDIINDPAGDRWPILDTPVAEYGMSIAGALFVVIVGYLLKRRNASRAAGTAR